MGDISARQLIDLMKKLNADMDTDKVVIVEYAQALNMWVATLKHLGSAIAVAFKDTKDKARDMMTNKQIFIDDLKLIAADSPQAVFLLPFCGEEAKFGIQDFNGDSKNKKPLKRFKKEDIKPWMYKYEATSRHLWRNQWLFTFLAQILTKIVKEREEKLSKLAKEVYKDVLKPNHPYWLQKVANAAMIAVNSRPKFLKSYSDEQSKVQGKAYDDEMAYAEIMEMAEQAQIMSDKLLLKCKQHGFDKLP